MSDIHIGSIRCACVANSKSSTFLVTGGSDESLRYIIININEFIDYSI